MNLKGHTLIELRDIHTGKVEKIESDNFITQFPSELFKQMGDLNPNPWTNRENSPIDDLFGGIMCFDSAITENADMTGTHSSPLFPPADKNMIANGSVALTGSSESASELGAYNASTSSKTATSRTFVYDWDTQEGNGTIASVCLTSKYGGYKGIGNHTSNGKDTTYRVNEPMQLPPTNNSGYTNTFSCSKRVAYINRTRNVIGIYDEIDGANGTATIKEYDITGLSINPFGNLDSIDGSTKRLVNTITKTFTAITDNIAQIYTGSAYGYYFIAFASNPYNDNNILNIVKFNTDNTQNQYRIPNVNLGYQGSYDQTTNTFAFVNGHLIVAKTSSNVSAKNFVWDINLSTNTPTELTEATQDGNHVKGCVVLEDRVYIGNYVVTVRSGGTIIEKQNGYGGFCSPVYGLSGGQFIDDPYSYYGWHSDTLYIGGNLMREYLATINNLQTPVVKTADKTMKITYTLTLQTS